MLYSISPRCQKRTNSLPVHYMCNKNCPQRKQKERINWKSPSGKHASTIGIQWNPKMALDFGRSP